MSSHLTRLPPPPRILRRRVIVGGKPFVLHIRQHKLAGSSQMTTLAALAPVRSHRAKLRWRDLADVLAEAFTLPAVVNRQRNFSEVIRDKA